MQHAMEQVVFFFQKIFFLLFIKKYSTMLLPTVNTVYLYNTIQLYNTIKSLGRHDMRLNSVHIYEPEGAATSLDPSGLVQFHINIFLRL
jgi:hypothetical protein